MEAIGKQMNRYDVFYTTIGYYLCMKNECDKSHNRDKKRSQRQRATHMLTLFGSIDMTCAEGQYFAEPPGGGNRWAKRPYSY